MKKYAMIVLILISWINSSMGQSDSDSSKLEQLRTESGVDPTRVRSRAGYTLMIYDQPEQAGRVNNRLSINIGIGKWAFSAKYDVSAISTGVPGTGFKAGMGDIKFSMLNAFYVKGKSALAAAAEFSVPTGKPGFGSQYFSVTPSITYSYTINPSLIFATQPQYSFDLIRDPIYPNLSVITVRSFLAKFTKTGYFFVFEPRPVFDLGNNNTDLVISPIIGKSLGAGFNLIGLIEIPLTSNLRNTQGTLYQFGFNKNF
jgi:Putative MetA-pathway of phenol degradation